MQKHLRRRLVITVAVLLLSLGVVFSVGAQTITQNVGRIGRIQDIEIVMVEVEVTQGGQTYIMKVPATLTIDHTLNFRDEDAVVIENVRRVGTVDWHIVAIDEYEESYIHSRYQESAVSSSGNKLVVVQSEVMNGGNAPFDIWSLEDVLGFDALGNTYEYADRYLDEINPGATGDITVVFDVPDKTEIVGLDLKVIDHKRLLYESVGGE